MLTEPIVVNSLRLKGSSMSDASNQKHVRPESGSQQGSPLRSLMAEAATSPYVSYPSLVEAQADPDGVMIMEGDDGGTIYVVCPARLVRCSQQSLERLLQDIDALVWREPDMARIVFERARVGQRIAGGLGGGIVTDQIWVHEELDRVATSIRAVITEVRPHLN